MRESWNRSRTMREHIEELEKELRQNPQDVTLRGHIRQLKKAWGLLRTNPPSPTSVAA